MEWCRRPVENFWASSADVMLYRRKIEHVRKLSSKEKVGSFCLSGEGSNFRSIHEAIKGKLVHGDISVLVTDKPGDDVEYARDDQIPVVVYPRLKSLSDGVSTFDLIAILRYSDPTIHFVEENYDTGRTLAQRVVPVLADDSVEDLAARVLEQEHKLYVEVVSALCDDRIVWREDGVPLIRSKENPEKLY